MHLTHSPPSSQPLLPYATSGRLVAVTPLLFFPLLHMCGIAGFVGPVAATLPQLDRMLGLIAHRGPDDSGSLLHDGVALGHRRLAILDLSPAGHQPMERGPLVLSFNGEIYNYVELREELRACGHTFASDSDSEVILAAYQQWGEGFERRLRGMWAFALLDRFRGLLLLSRDRFGIKPLHLAWHEKTLYFASEIKPLLAVGVSSDPDLEMWADLLVTSMLDHVPDRTYFKHVSSVPPGCTLVVDIATRHKTLRPYYVLKDVVEGQTSTPEAYEAALQESIRIHLRSDVPVGVCLSGGLDSSTIAALASPIYRAENGSPILAITARSHDHRDEGAYAEKVVQSLGLDWHQVMPHDEDFIALARCMVEIQEQPMGSTSAIMEQMVMRGASERGLKVLLDGQGADETMLGYERYYTYALSQWFRQGRWSRAAKEAWLAVRHSRLSARSLFLYYLYFQVPGVRSRVLANRSGVVHAEVVRDALARLERVVQHQGVHGMQLSQVTSVQLPHQLRCSDRNAMALSIETRVPYVDHRVVEEAIKMPVGFKIKDGYTKYALRLVSDKLLPPEITWRRNKVGFEAPVDYWNREVRAFLSEQWASSRMARELFSIASPDSLSGAMSYAALEMLLWEERFMRSSA